MIVLWEGVEKLSRSPHQRIFSKFFHFLIFFVLLKQFIGITLTTLLLISCQSAKKQKNALVNCGDDGEFILIPAGQFISGSDRAERDYAYQISAIAAARKPADIPQEEALYNSSTLFMAK
jgi:hypothetical protein